MTAHSPGLVQGQYFVMMLEVCHTTFVNKTIAKSSLLDFDVRYNPSSLENRYFQRLGCCKPVWETRGNILESFSMVWRCSRIICERPSKLWWHAKTRSDFLSEIFVYMLQDLLIVSTIKRKSPDQSHYDGIRCYYDFWVHMYVFLCVQLKYWKR